MSARRTDNQVDSLMPATGGPTDTISQAFAVFHVKRHAPDQIHVTVVHAPCADMACEAAEHLFEDSLVLRVTPHDHPRPDDPYPRARMINGRFEAASQEGGD